jgi:hypothetical protein
MAAERIAHRALVMGGAPSLAMRTRPTVVAVTVGSGHLVPMMRGRG